MWRIRFSVMGLLVATAAVAFFTAKATQNWGTTTVGAWATVLMLQLIAFGTCIEVLARNVPRAIAELQHSNCVRADGTWSKRRERIEEQSRNQLRLDLAKAILLVAMGTNVAAWFVHSEVIPIPIAVEALSSFHLDEGEWKASLSDDEGRFDGWMSSQARLSPSEALGRKRILWKRWPIGLGVVAIGIAGCCAFVAAAYKYSLKELAASVRFRSERYRLKSLHESVGHDDFARAKPVKRRRSAKNRSVIG